MVNSECKNVSREPAHKSVYQGHPVTPGLQVHSYAQVVQLDHVQRQQVLHGQLFLQSAGVRGGAGAGEAGHPCFLFGFASLAFGHHSFLKLL